MVKQTTARRADKRAILFSSCGALTRILWSVCWQCVVVCPFISAELYVGAVALFGLWYAVGSVPLSLRFSDPIIRLMGIIGACMHAVPQ